MDDRVSVVYFNPELSSEGEKALVPVRNSGQDVVSISVIKNLVRILRARLQTVPPQIPRDRQVMRDFMDPFHQDFPYQSLPGRGAFHELIVVLMRSEHQVPSRSVTEPVKYGFQFTFVSQQSEHLNPAPDTRKSDTRKVVTRMERDLKWRMALN
jgi:hypothetical protein